MGVDYQVLGYRDLNDPKLETMIELKRICDKLGIDYPKEMKSYFKAVDDEYGLAPETKVSTIKECMSAVNLESITDIFVTPPTFEDTVVEIKVSKLPKDVSRIALRIF